MKELSFLEWTLVFEISVIFLYLTWASFSWLTQTILSKIFKRDLEQEAIDRVFKHRKIEPGETVVITYKNGVVVTMSLPD